MQITQIQMAHDLQIFHVDSSMLPTSLLSAGSPKGDSKVSAATLACSASIAETPLWSAESYMITRTLLISSTFPRNEHLPLQVMKASLHLKHAPNMPTKPATKMPTKSASWVRTQPKRDRLKQASMFKDAPQDSYKPNVPPAPCRWLAGTALQRLLGLQGAMRAIKVHK